MCAFNVEKRKHEALHSTADMLCNALFWPTLAIRRPRNGTSVLFVYEASFIHKVSVHSFGNVVQLDRRAYVEWIYVCSDMQTTKL